MNIENLENVRSRRDHNLHNLKYPNNYQINKEALDYILVETIVAYKFLKENNYEEIIEKYDLKPFEMLVQTYERTLIDKLFAMCDYYLENKTKRYSRHIYDVHMIWTKSNVDVERIKALVPNIIKDRQANGDRNISSKSGSRPQKLLRETIEKDFYKVDFIDITDKFIYESCNYDEAINSLNEIIHLNILPEEIN